MLLMGKLTISTGQFSSSQSVSLPGRVPSGSSISPYFTSQIGLISLILGYFANSCTLCGIFRYHPSDGPCKNCNGVIPKLPMLSTPQKPWFRRGFTLIMKSTLLELLATRIFRSD